MMTACYLFVPAHRANLVEKAHLRHAEWIILDLEDSVPAQDKAAAREALSSHVDFLAAHGQKVIVRINRDLANCVTDLKAATRMGVKAVMIPKVLGGDHIRLIAEQLTIFEREQGLATGAIAIIALIETPGALGKITKIAKASHRLTALALGTEDFSTECGFSVTPENLFGPCQQLILAARSHGLDVIGLPGSIGEITNMENFANLVTKAKDMGFDAVMCIHPKQVAVINQQFAPDQAELVQAQRIIEAFEEAEQNHLGAIQLDGKMIDPPIVARAQKLLKRHGPRKA